MNIYNIYPLLFNVGTTLNLLKFPVINPEPWKLARRVKRLKVQKKEEAEERAFHKAQFQETKQSKYLTLMGRFILRFCVKLPYFVNIT